MLGAPALDGRGRAYVVVGAQLLMFEPQQTQPSWGYAVGGSIVGSPVYGVDGMVRVHSTDGHLHLVNELGERALAPVAVGPPLAHATPLVDGQSRTWIARSEGGLICVGADGTMARRPYYRSRRRFDCTGLILGDMLYAGTDDHYVRAIDLSGEEGENRWEDSAAKGRTGCPISAALAVSNEREILAISQDDHLYAFQRDGELAWKVALPGQVLGAPVVTREGLVLVGVSQAPRGQVARGALLAIDSATRTVRWQYQAGAPVESTPVIGDDDTIYFGDNSGTIHAVNAAGQQIWQEPVGVPVRSAGAILGPGIVMFGLDDGSLVALECSSTALASRGWPCLLGTATHAHQER